MADKIDKKTREWCEAKIYQVFDILDPTKENSNHYKKVFSKMNNNQFYDFCALNFPYIFHSKPFEIEPDTAKAAKACDALGIPFLDKLATAYIYVNKDGVPVCTKECLVGPLNHKKVQQFITKKNSMSTDINQRDMKTGLLTGYDKNGKTSDREMESLAANGLYHTMKEFGTYRADSMNAKNLMYNIINTKGEVSQSEVEVDTDDSLSRKLMDTYMIGSLLKSNMITDDYYTAYTVKEKNRKTLTRA